MLNSVMVGSDIKIIRIPEVEELKAAKKSDSNCYASGAFRVKYFPSVNSMYLMSRYKRGKVLDPDCVNIRIHAHNQMAGFSSRDSVPDDGSRIGIELYLYMNHSINRRDLDNCFKFLIDTLAEYYKFNDNRIYMIQASKYNLLDSPDEELLFYRINKDVRPDNRFNVSIKELMR